MAVDARAAELPSGDRTVSRMVELGAERWPGRPWLRHAGVELTYADARRRIARSAGALAAAGVGPGDRVAAMAANRLELFDLILGAVWLGAIAVPINAGLRGAQLEHVLTDAEPALLVVERDLAGVIPPGLPDATRVRAFDEWEGAGDPLPPHPARPGDPFAILYTSGTTGPAKGVVCPQAQFYWWGLLTGRCLGLTGDDRLYTTLPLFHTNALNTAFQALLVGATYEFGTRFSASRFWEEIRAADATVTYLLGAMVSILVRRPTDESDGDHRLRAVLAPATSAETTRLFTERFGVRTLVDGYGSTETNMVCANTLRGYRPGLMGWPLDEFEAAVHSAEGRALAAGEAGELVVRAREPLAFARGYWRMPEATAEAWSSGWFRTGDRVVVEPDGAYRFLDRLNEGIRRRGENVSSWDVEQALQSHPAIEVAAVVPVPSELGDDEVLAFLVARRGAELDFADVVRWCRPRLAHFAIPRYLEAVDALPLTQSGKVRKVALRARGVGPGTWDREAAGVTLRRR